MANWESALGAYIDRLRFEPFSWGVNDCVTFANGAAIAQTGKGFATEFINKYSSTAKTAGLFRDKLKAESGFDFIDVMDKRLTRSKLGAPRGSIIARKSERQCLGYSLGISLGVKAAFVGEDGLVFGNIEPDDIAWLLT